MTNVEINIDTSLVSTLITAQFPQWAHLSIWPVVHGGWDNRTFHLGDQMLIRMPSGSDYAAKVVIEQKWLPEARTTAPSTNSYPFGYGSTRRRLSMALGNLRMD
jgi:aminoglycoside phosphotransferase (APT) family kinase protein